MAELDQYTQQIIGIINDGGKALAEKIASLLRAKDQDAADLRAALAKLGELFPCCGHRKIDWDNSYGDCVACQHKRQSDAYDNLPLEVVECHDKIEGLEARLAENMELGREYIAKTDPLLSCSADPETGTCGECRECYWMEIKRIKAELDKLRAELGKMKP